MGAGEIVFIAVSVGLFVAAIKRADDEEKARRRRGAGTEGGAG